jgi:hypothetical protein
MKTNRFYYLESIDRFCTQDTSFILGELVKHHEFALEENQRSAWEYQIRMLREWLIGIEGHIILEYNIPRMGRRIDCIIISGAIIFAVEFKVGASTYETRAINQVFDYALDLKNFHEQSHNKHIIPILICTKASEDYLRCEYYEDRLAKPLCISGKSISNIILNNIETINEQSINIYEWIDSIYKPTPTII